MPHDLDSATSLRNAIRDAERRGITRYRIAKVSGVDHARIVFQDIMDVGGFIGLDDAAKLLPGIPSRTSVWRMTKHGRRYRGRLVFLKSVPGAGGKILTTRQWIAEFIQELAATSDVCSKSTPPRQSGDRRETLRRSPQREAKIAAAELAIARRVAKRPRAGDG